MPSPLNDFPQQLHGFSCAKSSSWSQLSNPSFNSSISPPYIARSSSIQPTQSLISPCPQSQLLGSPFDLSASFSEPAYNEPTAEPQIHMLKSPPKNSFVLSPQPQPSDYSTEAFNLDSFANFNSYDNTSVSAPPVQSAQPNPQSRLSNPPIDSSASSPEPSTLGSIVKRIQMQNSPLSSLTSSPELQAVNLSTGYPCLDVTSELVLHACHVASCSDVLIK